MRYHLTPVKTAKINKKETTNISEDVEKGEPSYTDGGNVSVVQPLWKTVRRFLKTFKIELPYDPAVALRFIYPKDTDVVKRRGTCTPMFIAVRPQ